MQRKERVVGKVANVHNQDSGHGFNRVSLGRDTPVGEIYGVLHLLPI